MKRRKDLEHCQRLVLWRFQPRVQKEGNCLSRLIPFGQMLLFSISHKMYLNLQKKEHNNFPTKSDCKGLPALDKSSLI